MKNIRKIVCVAGILGTLCAFPVMAAEWKQESDGRWWYQNDDGSYPVSEWKVIDDKEYYFDAEGYMAENTTIDGKEIGADGTVMTQEASAETTEGSGEDEKSETVTDTAEESEADTEESDWPEVGTDEELALRTLKTLYNSSDKDNLIIYSVKCEDFNYVSGNREKHHYRICMINYAKNFSDIERRYVGYYDSNVFTTTTTPVDKFGGRTLREASNIVVMDDVALMATITQ
jgi:hypothetical protein